VLCFIDSGNLPGPDLLRRHLAEHDATAHAAVIGYLYGYNLASSPPAAAGDIFESLDPAEIVAQFGDDPEFMDMRHKHFVRCGFNLSSRAIPWDLFWSGNCSVRSSDFWAVGGFDESYISWGGEDIELGFRLYRRGLTFRINRDAWAIEWPHERPDFSVLKKRDQENFDRYLHRTPEPVMEVGYAVIGAGLPMYMWDDLFRELNDWSGRASDLTVAGEIAEAAGSVPAGKRIAVLGCGGALPASLPPAVVMDFDRPLLDQALARGRHAGYNSIGLRTPLADQSVDTVIITSRLSGLWERWHETITREAERIAQHVIRTFDPPFNTDSSGD